MTEDLKTALETAAAGSAEVVADLTIALEFTWHNTLPVFIALLANSTSGGHRYARLELERMALTADLAGECIQLIKAQAESGVFDESKAADLLTRAGRYANRNVGQVASDGAPAPAPLPAQQRAACGLLAKRLTGRDLVLEVCCSANGFYIGTCDDEMPCSRESVEYWPAREAAQHALDNGGWTQRKVA